MSTHVAHKRHLVLVALACQLFGCSPGQSPSPSQLSAPTAPDLIDATGTVINTFSNEAVAGALITIETGSEAGQATRTASNGVFEFTGLTSLNVVVRVEADGFERDVDNLSAHSPITLRMEPLITTSQWSGTLKAFDQWIGWPGPFDFDIHHAGPTTLTFTVGCVTFGTYGEANAIISQLPGPATRLQLESGSYPGMPPPTGTFHYERTGILPAGHYQLTFGSIGSGWTGCPWTLMLSRPE